MLFVHKDEHIKDKILFDKPSGLCITFLHIKYIFPEIRNINCQHRLHHSWNKQNPQKKTNGTEKFIFFFLPFYRAQERSAWRQARMKSLEQDALQAQKMIQNMNELADDILDTKNEVIAMN